MDFTIITPSFNQLEYLKRCVASVADQATEGMGHGAGSMEVHHHVQDGQSTDGTPEWLAEYVANQPSTINYQLTFASEADEGMYDAINKGVEYASGIVGDGTWDAEGRMPDATFHIPHSTSNDVRDRVVAWLNCDEQYLSGTLRRIAEAFSKRPAADILCGDMLVVDEAGQLLSYRKAYAPRRAYIEASHLYTLSCATFYRRAVFDQVGPFDSSFKAAADEAFFLQALREGFRAAHVSGYCSAFTFRKGNLGRGEAAHGEHLEMKGRASGWVRCCKPVINGVRFVEKWLSGAYSQKFPVVYDIYLDSLESRCRISSNHASWKWPNNAQ